MNVTKSLFIAFALVISSVGLADEAFKVGHPKYKIRCNRPLDANLKKYVKSDLPVTYKLQATPRLYWLNVDKDGRIHGNASEEDTGTVDFYVDVTNGNETLEMQGTVTVTCFDQD